MGQRTIALLYGRLDRNASQDEKDVLVQVETVRAALQSLGYMTMDVPLSLDLGVAAAVLRSSRPLLVFNLAETIEGKGSLIHLAPSLLTTLGIPYTGAPAEAILLTSHKILGKRIMEAAGIATPPYTPAAIAVDAQPRSAPPWIVKSVWEHASIGMEDSAVVSSQRELSAEIRRRSAAERIDQLFVEHYVEGREINIALLGGQSDQGDPQYLPPAEIQFLDYPPGKPRFVGYRAKWDEASFEYSQTPRRFDFPERDSALLDTLRRISRDCWDLFGLRGYARVDFRVDADGTPWVLEVNTNPCLSPDAGFMAAAARAGLSRDEVVRRIIHECDSMRLESAAAANILKKEPDAWAPR
ncbi:MAG TPA: D-alanine--D-alanine ligase [Spirochaetia bacterium]|nr:D-alanine--D-alanine ligase [Spirochaetia bacterium]